MTVASLAPSSDAERNCGDLKDGLAGVAEGNHLLLHSIDADLERGL